MVKLKKVMHGLSAIDHIEDEAAVDVHDILCNTNNLRRVMAHFIYMYSI